MEEKKIEMGLSLYEMNKQLMANESPLDPIMLNQKVRQLTDFMVTDNNSNDDYFMLLCNERKDFTVFHITEKATVSYTDKEIRETLNNRGFVLSIDKQEDGNFEIWIRDFDTKENFVYYLFNYKFGVIEC